MPHTPSGGMDALPSEPTPHAFHRGSSASAGVHHRHRTPARLSPRNRDRLCNAVIHLDNSIVQWGGAVVMAQLGRGRGGPVTMLPLFRSQTQALVLTRLLLGPGEESLTDLAIAVGTYKNAVKHEVDRLEAAGLVSSRPVGRSRLVSVSAGEPVRSILLDLVLHTYGPIHVVGEELSGVAGIARFFLVVFLLSVVSVCSFCCRQSKFNPHR